MKINFRKISLHMIVVALASAFILVGCASNAQKNKETPVVWDSAIKHGTMENGMDYFIRKNSYPANRISIRLVVKAGSAMEDDDQKGVAHLVEHMAFNGSEHFEKSAIVDYFEKIGMNFGADLNAFTTFEQTTYVLEVPADDPEMLETAMLILRDYATGLTFPEEEVEKERGVVTEEWRLQENLQGRASRSQFELLVKDSRFEDRFPIGEVDIIKNVSRDRIIDFYKKWYRPEIMSVIVVGDEDPEVLENAVKKAMSTIPASKEKIELPKYDVPVTADKKIDIFRDPELPYTNVYIFNPIANYKIRETEEDIQRILAKEFALQIFNTRLNEIANSPDSTWLFAAAQELSLTNWSMDEYHVYAPKPGMFVPAMLAYFDEIDKFLDFGVTESELERMKMAQLSQAELSYQNRDKIENSNHASTIMDYVLVGKIPVSSEDYKDIYNKVIPKITVEQVNEEARKAFGDRGTKMQLLLPQNEEVPTEDVLYTIWTEYKNAEIAAYEDDVSDSNLMEKPSKKGKVVSKNKNENLGTTEYKLDNGIKIITKKTDFEANYMYMNVTSKGGSYLLDEKDVPSSSIALSYMLYSGFKTLPYNQLMKKLQTKTANINFNIDTTSEYIIGNCKVDDSETLLQFVNLMFTQANFTDESWQIILPSLQAQAEAHGTQPGDWYNDKILEILFGKGDVYHSPLDVDFLNKISAESAERVYKDRFANPADFTYIFVGDFDEDALIEDCCYYLGSLATTKKFEETVYKYWDFPKGKISETVEKGIGDQGIVYMTFGGSLPQEKDIEVSYKESVIIGQLQTLMDIRLREVIREDKSGSYGIGVNAYIDGYPERYYRVNVNFGCEPGRVKELNDEVVNQIKKIQNEPIDSIYIEKLKETVRRTRETNLNENNWWMNRINAELVYDYEPEWVTKDVDKLISWITPENLQEAAKKYLNPENYVSVFLVPEK